MLLTENKYLSLVLSVLLLPLALLYCIAVSVRNFLYDRRILSSYEPEIFTVSIGNITAGGTGKTPAVINLVRSLSARNVKTLVVTRGYGRDGCGRVTVSENTAVSESGDEAMIIRRSTDCSVVCDKDRTSVLKDLSKEFDIAVLDDAFQHRKVKKDLDIVLVDESRFLGNRLVLPSGILRDRVSRLKHCDVIVLSKVKDLRSVSSMNKIKYLERFGKKVLLSRLKYDKIQNGESELNFSDLKGKKISVFCGIGNPKDFFSIFGGMNIISEKSFSDHYGYKNAGELLRILKKDSEIMITTYKDFVKLSPDMIRTLNIYYLDSSMVFFDNELKETDLYDIITEYGFEKK
jgi:tetraacyldisaccharide 4'-kinase